MRNPAEVAERFLDSVYVGVNMYKTFIGLSVLLTYPAVGRIWAHPLRHFRKISRCNYGTPSSSSYCLKT